MNRYLKLLLIFTVPSILASCVPTRLYNDSQQEVNRLKKELADLYDECNINNETPNSGSGVYRAECPEKNIYASINSVQASRSGQSITINFQVLNKGADIRGSSVADRTGNTRRGTNMIYNGNSHMASSVTYAGKVGGYGDLITNAPLKGSVKFTGILPSGDMVDFISLELRGICKLEFRGVALQWSR